MDLSHKRMYPIFEMVVAAVMFSGYCFELRCLKYSKIYQNTFLNRFLQIDKNYHCYYWAKKIQLKSLQIAQKIKLETSYLVKVEKLIETFIEKSHLFV